MDVITAFLIIIVFEETFLIEIGKKIPERLPYDEATYGTCILVYLVKVIVFFCVCMIYLKEN